MTYDAVNQETVYIIVSGKEEKTLDLFRENIDAALHSANIHHISTLLPSGDPFMLHLMLAYASLEQSKPPVQQLRHNLYDHVSIASKLPRLKILRLMWIIVRLG